MYSKKIIERSQSRVEQDFNINLKRYSEQESWDVAAHLDTLLDPNGRKVRDLTTEEATFVQNETLLSKIDFFYFCRYMMIDLDGGGYGPLKLKESQELALHRYFAPAEEKMWEQVEEARKRGDPEWEHATDGLRFYWNKARQLYATTTVLAMAFQRLVLGTDVRAIMAPAEDSQLIGVYDRDKKLYDGLRWWMKPSLDPRDGSFDVKGDHIYFGDRRTSITYYSGTTKGNIGQGLQFQIQHITETAYWPNPSYQLDYILDPTLPQSIHTLAIRESTANGRGGFWFDRTEDARHGRSQWSYIFMPWYAVSSKRRRFPPPGWIPNDLTLQHADLVLRTSPEWVGRPINLAREQLYWWESERKDHQRNNMLAAFYTNYPATPEESFQRPDSAFPLEQIELWRLGTSIPSGLEVVHRG